MYNRCDIVLRVVFFKDATGDSCERAQGGRIHSACTAGRIFWGAVHSSWICGWLSLVAQYPGCRDKPNWGCEVGMAQKIMSAIHWTLPQVACADHIDSRHIADRIESGRNAGRIDSETHS